MGTRGGRPEPQAVAARTAGRNASRNAGRNSQHGPAGNAKAGNGKTGNGKTAAAAVRAAAAKQPPEELTGLPRWFRLGTLILSLAGLGISIYLTYVHYTTPTALACPDTGIVNCVKVTTSPQSYVLGIPVAVLGLAFYVFMVAVNSPWGWRSRQPVIAWARLVSVVIGIVFVLYLIYVELIVVNAICLWCTGVHIVTFLLFSLIVAGAAIWGLNRGGAAPA